MPAKTTDKKPAKKRAKKAPKIAQKQKQTQSVTVNVNATAPRARPRARPRQPQASGPKPTPSISNYNFPNSSQPYHNSPWSSLDNGRNFGSGGQSQQQQTAFMNMFTGQMQQILNPFMEQMRQTQAQPQATAPVEQEQQQSPVDQQQSQPMDVEPETTEADYSHPVGNETDTGPGIKTEPNSQPMEFDEQAKAAPAPGNEPNQRTSERGGVKTKLSDDLSYITIRAKDAKEQARLGRIAKRLGLQSLNNGDTISLDGWVMEPSSAGNEVYYNNRGLRWNAKSKKLSIDPKSSDARAASVAESAPITNNRPELVAPASKRGRSS